MPNINGEIWRSERRRGRPSQTPTSAVGTNISRDPTTGQRVIRSADGGLAYATYLGNAKPQTVPELYLPGGLGRSGLTNSKPAG